MALNIRRFIALPILLLLFFPLFASGSTTGVALAPTKTVTYCSPGGVSLLMDLYLPSHVLRSPAVILIHGGGLVSGDRQKIESARASLIVALVNSGYVVAPIDYRLGPHYGYLAQVQDVECAVRYLRANAVIYKIDTNGIGLYGDSAGGYLALMVASSQPAFNVGPNLKYSGAVEAVVDVSGPTDLTTIIAQADPKAPQAIPTLTKFIDTATGSDNPTHAMLWAASPISYISSRTSPSLMLYGLNDTLVAYAQGVEMQNAMQHAGIKSQLILVDNAGHVLNPISTNPNFPETPSQTQILQDEISFFNEHL
jgi:acetyl esterase/lipase